MLTWLNGERQSIWKINLLGQILSITPSPKKKKFANYLPGFIHIDVFYLPKIQKKKYYCFLAIDSVTLRGYPRKSQHEAADFLIKCLEFFPYRIHRILTDYGREFSLKKDSGIDTVKPNRKPYLTLFVSG